MAYDPYFGRGRARTKVWAALTLMVAVTGVSAIAIADAQGHTVRSDKTKSCNSGLSTGCLAGTNSGEGSGVLGKNIGNGDGVDGNSTGAGNGVTGTASKGYGVVGSASGTQAGVGGFSTGSGSSNPGVFGDSGSGPGVSGLSDTNAGVFGTSPSSGDGVDGTAGPGNGIAGTSTSGYGVQGSSSGKDAGVGGFNSDTTEGVAAGVYGFSSEGFGVFGQTGTSSSYGLFSSGNAFVDGEIFTSGNCKDGCTRTRHVAAFASRTSQPTIDDVGETSLRDGVARVALAADFANTIDLSKPYVVMLTPEGDAALYVASRTASGFEVRQIGGGRSSIAFAYRIVAKPYGLKDERLPFKIVPDAAAFKRHQLAHRSR
jgi:hypothetical protein